MLVYPLLSTVLSLVSLVFTFVCLFAGSKPEYLENYHLLTVNTSRIGAQFVKQNVTGAQSQAELHDVTSYINLNPALNRNEINTTSLAALLGLNDFYSGHMMTFCEGTYGPIPVTNATLPRRKISKDVNYCSPGGGWYGFNPTKVLELALWESNTGITLEDLEWPEQITKSTNLMASSFKASFFFYCTALAMCFARLFTVCIRFSFRLMDRVPYVLIEYVTAGVASFFLLLSSIILTAAALNGANVINKHGKAIGIGAYAGDGFFALSWVAALLMGGVVALGFFGSIADKKEKARKAEEDYERRISRRVTRRQTKTLESVWTDPIIRQKKRETTQVSGNYAEPVGIQSW